jgi:hypothetical protein
LKSEISKNFENFEIICLPVPSEHLKAADHFSPAFAGRQANNPYSTGLQCLGCTSWMKKVETKKLN